MVFMFPLNYTPFYFNQNVPDLIHYGIREPFVEIIGTPTSSQMHI